MKRVCTEEEKELLLKNKKQMLQGINWTSRNGSWGVMAVVYIVPVFIAFAAMMPFIIMYDLHWIIIGLGLTVVDFISSTILWLIINSIRSKKETKAFLSQKNLSVNGATIVEVSGLDSFAYIEDDVHDETGKPIIIGYPSTSGEIEDKEVGSRLLVMYDDAGNYQLFKLNDELKSLIPSYTADYPLAGFVDEYMRVPHPNMICIEKEGRDLTDTEREEFANMYVKRVQGVSLGMAKKAYIALFIIGAIFVTLLNFVEDGVPFETSLPYAVLIYVGFGAFFSLMFLLGRVNLKRQGQFVHKQEVVFRSYDINNNVATVRVYEWENGCSLEKEYPAGNVSTKTKYGSVIYKFTNKKGKPVLINR